MQKEKKMHLGRCECQSIEYKFIGEPLINKSPHFLFGISRYNITRR